jgi:hypothetical protein
VSQRAKNSFPGRFISPRAELVKMPRHRVFETQFLVPICEAGPMTSISGHFPNQSRTMEERRDGRGTRSVSRQSPTVGLSSYHCTALHCTALHCTALHCTALHCTALHSPALNMRLVLLLVTACASLAPPGNSYSLALHSAPHCTALHCTALHYGLL